MENLKTDVVVMGTGGAGLCAAVSAAERGAKVIVLEKRSATGGISNMGMGIFAVGSRLQRQKNIPFSRDEAFKLFMDRTHWNANARLVRAYIDKTASTIDWFEKMGVEFKLLDSYTFPGCINQTGHIVQRKEQLPSWGPRIVEMTKALITRAKKLDVQILLGTAVKKILKDGGRITGVVAEDREGNTIEVKAKALVVASGGYATDEEMLKKYGGFELGRDLLLNHDIELAGDGIKMAWEVGAASEEMCPQLIYWYEGPGFIDNMQIMVASRQPYVWINREGERFMDEGISGNANCVGNAIARQKGRCAYSIFDGSTKKHLEEEGVDYVFFLFPEKTKLVDLDADIKRIIDRGHKHVFMANSLKELGNKIGVNPDVLQKTINEYNKFCEKSHDDLFAKDPRYLQPVQEPQFYAFKHVLGAFGTVGGIKINERAQVLNKEFEVIPGLYAAGDCANGTHAYDYSLVYVLWGSTLGFAVNTGRIAGENAAAYAKSLA